MSIEAKMCSHEKVLEKLMKNDKLEYTGCSEMSYCYMLLLSTISRSLLMQKKTIC